MKNWERWIVYPLLAGLVLVVLCCWYPRVIEDNNLKFDYLGLVVGILSLLVTVLIGWNIYSVLNVNRRIDNTEKNQMNLRGKMEEMFTHIDKSIAEIDDLRVRSEEYAMGSISFMQGFAMMKTQDDNHYCLMYRLFASSMIHYLECDNQISENLDKCLDNMCECLGYVKQDFSDRFNNYDQKELEGVIRRITMSKSSEFNSERRRRFFLIEELRIEIEKAENARLKEKEVESLTRKITPTVDPPDGVSSEESFGNPEKQEANR